MATGALDAWGVWQHGEDDVASPTSTMLNKPGVSLSNKFALTRSWRSVHTGAASTLTPAAGVPTSIIPSPIVITSAPAGTYRMDGMANAYFTSVTAATVQFMINGTIAFEPRNDVTTFGICQMHAWTFDHAGGTLTLDYRILSASAVAVTSTGTGLIVSRVL